MPLPRAGGPILQDVHPGAAAAAICAQGWLNAQHEQHQGRRRVQDLACAWGKTPGSVRTVKILGGKTDILNLLVRRQAVSCFCSLFSCCSHSGRGILCIYISPFSPFCPVFRRPRAVRSSVHHDVVIHDDCTMTRFFPRRNHNDKNALHNVCARYGTPTTL